MNQTIDDILDGLRERGNLREIPADGSSETLVDFTSNDYLGIGTDPMMQDEFLASVDFSRMQFTASASRLLARSQSAFGLLERTLEEAYGHGRKALTFNSGYHANTGLISSFAGTSTYILADKLVHASIIDGIRLSGLPFDRFRHNDTTHLVRLAEKARAGGYDRLLIVVESVYSMDGDRADIAALTDIKKRYPGALLYVDEAHGVGVEGPAGLGLCAASDCIDDVDIIVGTLGKALASSGAFAILSESLRSFMVNRARSFIFSTALPPVCALWSRFTFTKAMEMDSARAHLRMLGHKLAAVLTEAGGHPEASHIQPLITGDPHSAVALSRALKAQGFDVLPIRTPTVPPGTDRLRFSLSAALDAATVDSLAGALHTVITDKPLN